jgi:hypothetical protein
MPEEISAPEWWGTYRDPERPPHFLARLSGSTGSSLRDVARRHIVELRTVHPVRDLRDPRFARYLALGQFENILVDEMQRARELCRDPSCTCHSASDHPREVELHARLQKSRYRAVDPLKPETM